MTCDIVIRSYWRDLEWLKLCLLAIQRYCFGFSEIIVIIPRGSEPWLRRQLALPSGVRLELCADYADDYLGQQVSKLYADQISNADFICHVDSDCIFRQPTAPDDLTPDGKPRVYMRPVELLPRHWPWTQPTSEFLGWMPTHDYLQWPPFTYPRWLYPKIRAWARRDKGVSLSDWVLSRPPRGFSEFNVLAGYAYVHHRDAFAWTQIAAVSTNDQCCQWFWSWGGLDAGTRRQIERILKPTGDTTHA